MDDGSAPLWVARNEIGEVVAARVYMGSSETEDLAMIGQKKDIHQGNNEQNLHIEATSSTLAQNARQDVHMKTMLLEQQVKKLLQ